MPISSTATSLVNAGGLGGNQTNVQIVHLTHGGFVVAWNTDLGGQKDVLFQRYDALGHTVGGPTIANSVTAGDQTLTDIVSNGNGTFTLAWTSGTTVTTRSFNGDTGSATSTEVHTTVTGTAASGAQLVATSTNAYKVVMTSLNGGATDVDQAAFNTSGGTVSAKANISTTVTGNVSISQLTDGNVAGEQFALLSDNTIFSTGNSHSATIGNATSGGDMIKLQNGMHVVLFDNNNSMNPQIDAFVGSGSDVGGASYSIGTPIVGGSVGGSQGTSPDVLDKAIVNLGGGRFLDLWAADTGTGGTQADGVYAQVYNTNVEFNLRLEGGTATQVDASNNIVATTISADILADGRVAVSWSNDTALTGLDVFTRILDPRVEPVTVNGSASIDSFVGTTFLGDTISYAASAAAVKVDMTDGSVNSGDAAGDILSGFENVTGGSGNDELYGDNNANVLIGNGGDDKLVGRDGNDSLQGGLGNDVLIGGVGDDHLIGSDGTDQLLGNAGNDVLDAGSGDDVAQGGAGNDTILGGDGNDKLHGDAGDDVIDGGNGNDTINGGDGDDIITGGAGNDVIAGGSGLNHIDGGADTDTVTYANILGSGGQGFYVDLDGSADPVGNISGFTADTDVIVNVENVIGSAGNDYLAGDAGANTLRGGAGDDTLFGRGGADKLAGGAGNDTFVFQFPTDGGDTIADFTGGSDKIELVSDNFGGLNAGNIGAQFVAGATPTSANANPTLLFDNAGPGAGTLSFDADGTGAGAAVVIATVTFTSAGGVTAFGSGDLLFV